jgi:hypothetical protein
MVFSFSQLIKSSGTETYPAAQTQSIGLPAYALLAQVFAEPSGSLTVTHDSQPSTGIIPSKQLCLDNETFSHLRDFPSGHKAFFRLPGFCKNSCQRVPRAATN